MFFLLSGHVCVFFHFNTVIMYIIYIYIKGLIVLYVLMYLSCVSFCCVEY